MSIVFQKQGDVPGGTCWSMTCSTVVMSDSSTINVYCATTWAMCVGEFACWKAANAFCAELVISSIIRLGWATYCAAYGSPNAAAFSCERGSDCRCARQVDIVVVPLSLSFPPTRVRQRFALATSSVLQKPIYARIAPDPQRTLLWLLFPLLPLLDT
jgi:hypothetical protein